MRQQMVLLANHGRQQITRWLRLRGQECHHCRECGGSIHPLDSVCTQCGASDPARINVSAGLAIGAVVFGLLLLGLWLT